VLDSLALVLERLRAVAEVDGAVEAGVGFGQGGRHRQRVVKVGQGRVGKFLARLQQRLRSIFHRSPLLGARLFGPRERVVDHGSGILVSAFQSTRYLPHPGHVHGRLQNAEDVESWFSNDVELVARHDLRWEITDRLL
jgi:hypothetical protein